MAWFPGYRTDMEASRPDSERASAVPVGAASADRCADAADAAAACASACLADPRIYDLEECIEWCLLGSQVLGSCAQVLARHFGGGRSPIVAAVAEVGLMAAVGCAEAVGPETSIAECGNVAARCADAADALREFLARVSDDSPQMGAAAS